MSRAGGLFLVTGGAGFIGSHLVERLLSEGARVRVLDDFSTGRRENLAPWAERIELVEGSVTRAEDCRRAVEGAEYVLHHAALASVTQSVEDPLSTHDVDATGTLRLLDAAVRAGVRRFVYAGSSSAYGDAPGLPKTEDMTPAPGSPYAVAKLAGEHYARAFAHMHGLETVVLRYFNVFGPRQDPSSPYAAAIAIFAQRALEGRAPTLYGDGEQTRDFVYVDDVVEANLLACGAPAEAVAGELFNVARGERTSINRVWELIRELSGSSVDAERAPARAGDVRDSEASLERIQRRLGYRAAVPLEEGLRRTLEWYRRSGEGGAIKR